MGIFGRQLIFEVKYQTLSIQKSFCYLNLHHYYYNLLVCVSVCLPTSASFVTLQHLKTLIASATDVLISGYDVPNFESFKSYKK